jgi:zinc D-Ala-D-Ala dipeptidase
LKNTIKSRSLLLGLLLIVICSYPVSARATDLPDGFVYVEDMVPGIKVELRYYSTHNFIGDRIDGYLAPRCILTKEAAEALKGVQEDLDRFGLGLKIFDAYRPQMAVDHFVRWAKDLKDIRMKKEFYPNVEKKNLFKEEYIALKSGHSRGSTVDLTVISLDAKRQGGELDMGTGFDYFGPQSWPENRAAGASQRAHRMLLQMVMEKHGFKPYPKEWWHFTLKAEPYPDTYFDFPVR